VRHVADVSLAFQPDRKSTAHSVADGMPLEVSTQFLMQSGENILKHYLNLFIQEGSK
jgi:hypothetical protein